MGRRIRTVREALDITLDYKELILRLRAELDRRRITRSELAKELKLAVSSISCKLYGTRPMMLEEFLAICQFSGIHPSDLMPGDAVTHALKNFSLAEYLSAMVRAEIKKTTVGDKATMDDFEVLLVPKGQPKPPTPPTEQGPDRRGRPRKNRPEHDGDGSANTP